MSGARPRRKSGGHARRPAKPLRRRIRRPRLRGGGRILALLLFTATIAGLVAGVYGPWMRVTALGHTGDAYTPAGRVQEILDDYRGVPDPGRRPRRRCATGWRRCRRWPTRRSSCGCRDELQVAITEKAPAFLWRTHRAVLVGARDGTIIAELPLDPDAAGRAAPRCRTWRTSASCRACSSAGDAVPPAELRVAKRLTALDPRLIGSRASALEVKVDYQMGFVLESTQPAWTAALGFYQLDPREDQAAADAKLEQQLAAIRTLFATRPERNVSMAGCQQPGEGILAP